MNKRILIGIVIAVVIAGGAAAYFFLRSGVDTSDTDGSGPKTSNDFAPAKTTDLAFTATLATTDQGVSSTATIKYDGQGKTHYEMNADGQISSVYMTDTEFITCTDGQCTKLPVTNSESAGVPQTDYMYSDEDFAEFRKSAKYEGRQGCPAGSCDVWNVEDNKEGFTTRVYLDPSTKRISQLTSDGPDSTMKITYTYEPVTITIPQNVQTIPGA